jgi:hypothetical protein
MTLTEVKIRFSPSDLVAIDAAAAAAGLSRSAYVRDRVTNSDSGSFKLTPAAYHRLVSDTNAFMRGDLNHNHIETLVAYVIRRLDQYQRDAVAGDHTPA